MLVVVVPIFYTLTCCDAVWGFKNCPDSEKANMKYNFKDWFLTRKGSLEALTRSSV
jgi:hypothetical protein